MLSNIVTGIAFVVGALVCLAGFGLAASRVDLLSGVWFVVVGAVVMIASIMQRNRYRSLTAELTNQAPGPGGGENGPLEPRFAPTDELFVDPTSGRPMRVFIDPRTGERRYLAQG